MAASIKAVKNDVEIEVSSLQSFEKTSKCVINYKITNHSKAHINLVRAAEFVDCSLILRGPDGSIIAPFPMATINHKMYYIQSLEPGEAQTFNYRVFPFFPLKLVGEYRCVLMRTVYEVPDSSRGMTSITNPGKPIEVSSPEFSLRILQIDNSYISPLEKVKPKQSQQRFTTPESNQWKPNGGVTNGIKPNPSPESGFILLPRPLNHWIGLIALLFVAGIIGVWQFLIWRRRKFEQKK